MKIKALFLLFIFLLNAAIGLNCALHQDEDCCDEIAEQHHDPCLQNQHDHQAVLATLTQKNTCCQNAVAEFAFLAKLVPQTAKAFLSIPVADIRSAYPCTFKLLPLAEVTPSRLTEEQQWPPTPDIRIFIQSFQV